MASPSSPRSRRHPLGRRLVTVLVLPCLVSTATGFGCVRAPTKTDPLRHGPRGGWASRSTLETPLFNAADEGVQIEGDTKTDGDPVAEIDDPELAGHEKDSQMSTTQAEIVTSSLSPAQIESISSEGTMFLPRLRKFFAKNSKLDRQSLSKLGMSALLAYGFVSNVSGVVAVSSAWFIFSKRTGLSPLHPGQKAAFFTLYAGFTVALNVIRPARFALSMAISPTFEKIRKGIQVRLGVGPKTAATLMIVFINLMGTTGLMCAGVGLASILSGVPIWSR